MAPDRAVNNAIGYLLAVVSQKYDIELNALCFLSDHQHNVNHDPTGRLPKFTQDLHSFVTRQLNAMFGDRGAMWDERQTNHVAPVTPEDILARIGYTMANPVHHGLVTNAKNWPGLRMSWPCKPRRFKRPKGWMNPDARRPDGSLVWPEYATLTMYRPRGFEHLTDAELVILINNAIAEAEKKARKEVADRGGSFVGRRQVLRTKRHDCATSEEQPSTRIPRFACKNETLRKQAIAEDRAWLREHNLSFDSWRNGDRAVVFPYGTYKMRVVHRVNVAPPPV